MEQVTQTALTDFRSPTEEEIERISQYVKKELSRQRRIQGFWMFFCGVIAFSMLLPPFLLWNPMETPAIIANLLIGIPTALGAIAIGKSYKRKKAVDPANMRRCLSGAGLLDLRNPVRKRPARSGLGEDLQQPESILH